MNCYKFNQLTSRQKIDYVYNNCRLLDFEVMHDNHREYGVCLYHNGEIFVEISFDGIRGDRISEIRSYADLHELSHWYDQVDIRSLLSHQN